jgi:bifunctional isochorismate lyase/aryl carrier protein
VTPLNRDHLVRQVADLARVSPEDIAGETDLTTLGLTSIAVMQLVNGWRVSGLPVTYRELVTTPTVDAWWARITHLMAANPYLAA